MVEFRAVLSVTTGRLVHTINISGLTTNSGYTFQVAAASVNKTGPFSETITLRGIVYYHNMLHIFVLCEFHIMTCTQGLYNSITGAPQLVTVTPVSTHGLILYKVVSDCSTSIEALNLTPGDSYSGGVYLSD